MSVSNGQIANANTFNNALMSRTQDTSTVGEVDLNNANVASGTQIENAQRELNKLNSFVGSVANTPYNTLPSWTNNDVGASTDPVKTRADGLTQKFNSATGHAHDGTAGGGAPISAADIINSPLEGWFNQGANINITGGSEDVSTPLTGKTPSTGPTVLGVVTNPPYNKAILREATGVDAGTAFIDGSGNEVYGRVTESVGVWTLTFYVDLSGTETAYSFGSAVDARWFYQELYNPLVNTPVYDPGAFVPSDAATADVIDATASQRGLVSTATQSFGGDKTFQDDVTVTGDLQISGLSDNEIAFRNAGTDKIDGIALAKGGLISADTGSVPSALPVGTNNQVLTADSAETLGVKWASVSTPAASGIAFIPVGDIAATDVQAAIAEVDSEKANKALSNLATTSIGVDLDPSANVAREIGDKSGNIFKDVSAGEFTTKVLNVSFVGDTTTSNATITNIADTSALNIYQTVTGAGIQAGSRIISKTVSTVVLDKTATATAGAVSLSAQYALIADSQPQVSTANSGGAFAKSGSVVDGTSGQAEFGTGNATGTGASGDALLKAGEVVSGSRGRALLDGRYAGLPTRTADPADFKAGGLFWNTTTGKFRQSDGSAWSDLAGSGGSGGINYAAANPGAETDTAGFTTYKNTAGTAPTTGTGGSPTFTITRTTGTPLRSTGSFLLTHDASNQQGEGAALPITIDRADRGQQVSISFDYEILSGVYATGDLGIYIVDVSNSTVIQPAAFQIVNVGVNSRHIGCVFQAASNSVSYRVCWHVATATATAYTLQFDNLIVGPQVVPVGAAMTDWAAYTPTTQGFGTISSVGMFWRRVGDSIEIQGRFTIGTATGSDARVDLPPGLMIASTAKTASSCIVGLAITNTDVGGSGISTFFSIAEAGQSGIYFGIRFNSPSIPLFRQAGSGLGTGNVMLVQAIVPVEGWSSNVIVSDSAATRVVAWHGYSNSSSGVSGFTQVTNWVTTKDTLGAFDTGTSSYTVKVPGEYRVSGQLHFAAAAASTYLLTSVVYKNGVQFGYGQRAVSSTANTVGPLFSNTFTFAAGDVITIYAYASSAISLNGSSGGMDQQWSIEMIQGPAQIQAATNVAARYTTVTAQSVGTAATIIDFTTKTYDRTNSVTTGASWKFTAPAYGIYDVAVGLDTSATAVAENTSVLLYKNGVFYSTIAKKSKEAADASRMPMHGFDSIELLAGEYIDLRFTSTAASFTLLTNAGSNYVTISRQSGVN